MSSSLQSSPWDDAASATGGEGAQSVFSIQDEDIFGAGSGAASDGGNGKNRNKKKKKPEQQQQQRAKRPFAVSGGGVGGVASAEQQLANEPEEWSHYENRSAVNERRQLRDDCENGCRIRTVRCWIKTSLAFDFAVGLTTIVYGSLLIRREQRTPRVMAGLSVSLGTVLLFRCLLAAAGSSMSLFNRIGLIWSANTSPAVAIALFILSMIALGAKHRILNYLADHETALHFSDGFVHELERHYRWVWIALLVWSVLENVRWQVMLDYRRWLLRWVDGIPVNGGAEDPSTNYSYLGASDDIERSSLVSDVSTQGGTGQRRPFYWRSGGRPWWWRTKPSGGGAPSAQLTQALMSDRASSDNNGVPEWVSSDRGRYEEQAGLSPPSAASAAADQRQREGRSWWQPGRREQRAVVAEDDCSVNFAPFQEEWQTRSDDDPIWWSRDNEEQGGETQQGGGTNQR